MGGAVDPEARGSGSEEVAGFQADRRAHPPYLDGGAAAGPEPVALTLRMAARVYQQARSPGLSHTVRPQLGLPPPHHGDSGLGCPLNLVTPYLQPVQPVSCYPSCIFLPITCNQFLCVCQQLRASNSV